MAFDRETARGVGTGLTQVGTSPASGKVRTIIGLVVSNSLAPSSAIPISVDVVLHDGVNITYIVRGMTLPVGSAFNVIGGDGKLVLRAGDSIRVLSSVASSCDVITSYLEQ